MKTKTETTYICEYCGKEFEEDELDLCQEHEEIEKLLHECRFWDSDRREVHGINHECMADGIFYFYAPTVHHIEAISDWFNSCGLDYVHNAKTAGLYVYLECYDMWRSVSEIDDWVTEIKNFFN